MKAFIAPCRKAENTTGKHNTVTIFESVHEILKYFQYFSTFFDLSINYCEILALGKERSKSCKYSQYKLVVLNSEQVGCFFAVIM